MLKEDLENIREEVLRKREETAEKETKERVKKVSEKYSEIIEKIISGLTVAANKGYTSCCVPVENFYMPDENELWYWARSEKINLTFKREREYISACKDRSKIKVIEIFPKF